VCGSPDLLHNEKCALALGHSGLHHQCQDGYSAWTTACFDGLDEFDGIVIRERALEALARHAS